LPRTAWSMSIECLLGPLHSLRGGLRPPVGAAAAAPEAEAAAEARSAFFGRWHATDIAWPPGEDVEGFVSTSRASMEENLRWLSATGAHVSDDVDVFDLERYLQGCGVRPEDVALCVWNCAHGRNYRADSTERHRLMQEWGWSAGTFRNAAFAAMCGQLPRATCVLTGRRWEPVAAQLAGQRPVLQAAVRYGSQRGPAYRPEPSTRGDRREGELGEVGHLVATVAVGPGLARALFRDLSMDIDIPELAVLAASGGGIVVFLGEFTLANARHCAQYACEQLDAGRPASPLPPSLPSLRGPLASWLPPHCLPGCRQLVSATPPPLSGQEGGAADVEREWGPERRRHAKGGCYSYAECLQHAQDQGQPHAPLVAAYLWQGMAPTGDQRRTAAAAIEQ